MDAAPGSERRRATPGPSGSSETLPDYEPGSRGSSVNSADFSDTRAHRRGVRFSDSSVSSLDPEDDDRESDLSSSYGPESIPTPAVVQGPKELLYNSEVAEERPDPDEESSIDEGQPITAGDLSVAPESSPEDVGDRGASDANAAAPNPRAPTGMAKRRAGKRTASSHSARKVSAPRGRGRRRPTGAQVAKSLRYRKKLETSLRRRLKKVDKEIVALKAKKQRVAKR